MKSIKLFFIAILLIPLSAGAEPNLDLIFIQARKTALLPIIQTSAMGTSCDSTLGFARRAYLSNVVHPHEYKADANRSEDQDIALQIFNYAEPYYNKNLVRMEPGTSETALRRYAWLKGQKDRGYFTVFQSEGNWRGDVFQIFTTGRPENARIFSKLYGDGYPAPQMAKGMNFFSNGSWVPVLFIYDAVAQKITYLEPQSFEWQAYEINKAMKAEAVCTIHFMNGTESKDFFPSPSLKKLARLLDDIIGMPASEGTLHPISNLHEDVKTYWRNAFFRPWALNAPANTRATVDKKLFAWSKVHWMYSQQYRQLKRLYPLAEKDLAAYYARIFHLKAGQAQTLAKIVLDSVFRNHFRYSNNI